MATVTESTATPTTGNNMSEADCITVDTQHYDMVHDAQLDYYGTKLATSSSDKTVKIYDVVGDDPGGNGYNYTATLEGHVGPVWEVSWAHPKFGVVLASCSFDGSVLIHRESTPHNWIPILDQKQLHESSVNSCEFAPHHHGLICAAASSDGRVSILTHQQDDSWAIQYISDNTLGVNSVSWCPDDGQTKKIVTGGCDNQIRFYTQTNAAENTTWEQLQEDYVDTSKLSHSDWVRDVSWAPSIIPNHHVVASCSEDGTVLIWNSDGTNGWKPTLLHQFPDPVWRVRWNMTGSLLAVSSGDDHVSLWKAGLDGIYTQVTTVQDMANPSTTKTTATNINNATPSE